LQAREIATATDPAKLQSEISRFQSMKQGFNETNDHWSKEIPDGRLKELATVKARQAGDEYIRRIEQDVIPAVQRGDKQKALDAINAADASADQNQTYALEADKIRQETVTDLTKRAGETVNTAFMTLFGIGVLVAIIVCFLGVVITRSILGPVTKTMSVLQSLADGDLRQSVEIDSTDELGSMGEALNRAIKGMADTIQSIAGTAEHVASASEEISSSATLQAQGAETQKDQTTQVATGMQEMAATVQQVSENSGQGR
jgi:methyl-accepting chemotaxis protein